MAWMRHEPSSRSIPIVCEAIAYFRLPYLCTVDSALVFRIALTSIRGRVCSLSMSYSPKKGYGFRVFVCSCIFTTVTIVGVHTPFLSAREETFSLGDFSSSLNTPVLALVLWDERSQRERRQGSVKERLKSIQQQQNMQEYEEQRQRYEEYKKAHSA
ncbi:unnamed protein product [Heligmosomoides polygyrus]|uniref:Transmembrane protein n=1 Tax=Heligmosomoides polygyrus TaxID=6339 RepID=A0A183G6K5_HELPZ|nr:unnamed protein product [Heligmosomoides polygyrus]